MPLIEGIGDEVTLVFGILLILIVVAIAWVSTNIRDIPFFSVIIVELTQRHQRLTAEQQRNQDEQSGIQHQHVPSETSTAPETSSQTQDSEQQITNDNNETENTITNSSSVKESGISSTSTRQSSEESVDADGEKNVEECFDKKDNDNICEGAVGSTDAADNQISESVSENCDSEENVSETELRRRRVAFFGQKKRSDSEINGDNSATDQLDSRSCSQDSDNSPIPCDTKVPVNNTRLDKTVVESENCESSRLGVDNNVNLERPNIKEETSETFMSVDSTLQGEEVELRNGQIRIRLKYLNDTQRNVIASPQDTIGQFRRDNFATELADNKLVRFIFNGRDLRNDSSTLQANNVVNDSVLHCLITQVNRQTPRTQAETEGGFDMGNVMLPLFGIILMIVWYLRFEYRQLFTATSTISLIGVTSLYIAALLASWESHRRGNRHEHID